MALQTGPTAAAISGSLGAMATIPSVVSATSATCGSSIPPRMIGHGWAEATPSAVMADSPECTAYWVRLAQATFLAAAMPPAVGQIAAAISGSLGAMVTIGTGSLVGNNPPIGYLDDLWEFNPSYEGATWIGRRVTGCLPAPPTLDCGPGWQLRHGGNARGGNPPGGFDTARSVGSTAAAISGSLEAKASITTAFLAILTTCGSSTLPQTNGFGWVAVACGDVKGPSPGVYGTVGTPAAW